MEIFEICAHLDDMLHRIIGLGTYRTYIGEAIKELGNYQQRLEYEDSCGYRNELDLMKDHVKDLEDENAILKEANERFHTKLRLATKYARETRTKLLKARQSLLQSDDEFESLTEELRQTQIVKDAQKKVIDEKENALLRLNHELWEMQEKAEYWEDLAKEQADWSLRASISRDIRKYNNPQNFCGNCKYYAQMGKDDDEYEGICVQHYIKRVDPDDASCEHFQSNQVDNVVVDKPDHPCCKACNRDNCDGCTLCPF